VDGRSLLESPGPLDADDPHEPTSLVSLNIVLIARPVSARFGFELMMISSS
jgi:hypothetical protein